MKILKKGFNLLLIVYLLIAITQKTKLIRPKQLGFINSFSLFADCNILAFEIIDISRGTTYQPTSAQCDSNALGTADGSRINPYKLQRWVALSRDLIYDQKRQNLFKRKDHWRGLFEFGDSILVHSKKFPNLNGYWHVHDCMASSYKKSIDFLYHSKKKMGIAKDIKILILKHGKRI